VLGHQARRMDKALALQVGVHTLAEREWLIFGHCTGHLEARGEDPAV
jgi:hypothetical protein